MTEDRFFPSTAKAKAGNVGSAPHGFRFYPWLDVPLDYSFPIPVDIVDAQTLRVYANVIGKQHHKRFKVIVHKGSAAYEIARVA